MTQNADAGRELDRAVEAELARRAVPPYRPDYALIVCEHCGRRLADDDGRRIHSWWRCLVSPSGGSGADR